MFNVLECVLLTVAFYTVRQLTNSFPSAERDTVDYAKTELICSIVGTHAITYTLFDSQDADHSENA